MKYYYNGNLVRTSKTHHYTHAVVTGYDTVFSCNSSEALAVKALRSWANGYKNEAENGKKAIKALDEGKSHYMRREGNRDWYTKMTYTREQYERQIEQAQSAYDWIVSTWKVVKLEER